MKPYGHIVNQLARSFTKKLNEKITPLGIYASQWAIILYLYEKKQATQVELCNYLSVEAPTITRTLTRMDAMGLIVRQEGKDKREKIISMTEKAYGMFPVWDAASDILESDATVEISEEDLAVFKRVIEKMISNLDTAGK